MEVMNLLHQKGVATVILSSTELGSPTHLGMICISMYMQCCGAGAGAGAAWSRHF